MFCSKIKENIEEKTGNNSYVHAKTKMPMFGTGFVTYLFSNLCLFLINHLSGFFFLVFVFFFFCPFHSDLFNFF